MNSFIIVIFIVSLWKDSISSVGCACVHRIPSPHEIVTGVRIDPMPENSRLKRSPPSHLRIHYEYTKSFQSNPNAENLKKLIMEPARLELQSMITAKNPTTGILRVDRACFQGLTKITANGVKGCAERCESYSKCLKVEVPEKYLKKCTVIPDNNIPYQYGEDGSGITDVDIVLLIKMKSCAPSTYAYAGSCFSENELDRPILGVLVLCKSLIDSTERIKENIKIVQHEIIHALGFAVEKFAFYRYPDGSPIVPRDVTGLPNVGFNEEKKYYLWNDKITKKVIRKRYSVNGEYTKVMEALVLPNVVKIAQEHFACWKIDAVDLEDHGGLGGELTHFDEYFVYNEIMSPETNNGIDVISKFTLAILKDTGWYHVDFSKAADLHYGKNAGCVLPLEGCFKFMQQQLNQGESLNPFCDTVLQFGNIARCSDERTYFTYCYLTKFNSILPKHQYFLSLPGVPEADVKYYAGSSEYNEFCPSYTVFVNPNSLCYDDNNNEKEQKYNVLPSYFGSNSACFENDVDDERENIYYGASCQKYAVDKRKSTLTVFFGSQNFTCPSEKVYRYQTSDGTKSTFTCPKDIRMFFQRSTVPHFLPDSPFILTLLLFLKFL